MKSIIRSLVILVAITSFIGCKKYLDVNKSPNSPEDVTEQFLLPSAQASIAQVNGNYLQIVGGIWGQYWTQNPNSSQYRNLEQYRPGPESANNAWTELYAGALTDLQKIIDKNQIPNYVGIAKILQAYTYQLLTDNFGPIPFSEALKGETQGISSPKYDSQEEVYNGIIQMVKDGKALLTEEGTPPGVDDFLYGGDVHSWDKFANTLLLRMYLRLWYVNEPLARQGIMDLESAGAEYIGDGETAQIIYSGGAGNTNPLYSEMVNLNRTQNLIASNTGLGQFLAREDTAGTIDPRIDIFYNINGPAYVGLNQGDYFDNTPRTYSYPGFYVGGTANPPAAATTITATAPVKFISSYESFFLQAEAAVRMGTGDAQALYESGISASFAEYKLSDEASSAYLEYYLSTIASFPAAGGPEEKVEAIITEKWIAMCGNQNIEAWTEQRRTGYPDFFVVSKNTTIGSTFPARIPYPETESTRNLNFPGQKEVTEKVWWDVKD